MDYYVYVWMIILFLFFAHDTLEWIFFFVLFFFFLRSIISQRQVSLTHSQKASCVIHVWCRTFKMKLFSLWELLLLWCLCAEASLYIMRIYYYDKKRKKFVILSHRRACSNFLFHYALSLSLTPFIHLHLLLKSMILKQI